MLPLETLLLSTAPGILDELRTLSIDWDRADQGAQLVPSYETFQKLHPELSDADLDKALYSFPATHS